MDFMIGCNYWDSVHGTDMWKKFDKDIIRDDINELAKYGVKYMRVFPNWRDFQPVMKFYSWHGSDRGYADYDENPITDINCIDRKQIENFKTFAGICEEYGIKLIVSVVTGWMSGRLFVPKVLENKNVMKDPEALMLTARFIKGFVGSVKDCKNIIMWELGNESNCMAELNGRYETYMWTVFVANAIRAADNTRPIASGMHSLNSKKITWSIQDQGEIVDYMTNHPYVSVSLNNDIDPMNKLRTTLLPTVQCMLYSDLSGKPTIIEEQGSFSEALGNVQMAADFGRVNIYSALAHGIKGWLWWCGMNHTDLKNTPYIWSMIERDLGMLNTDKSPKPIALTVKETADIIGKLPFESLPEREIDGVCVLTNDQNHWDNCSPAFVLAKQAGFEIRFTECDDPLPDSELYIFPGLAGWAVMDQHILDKLFENVKKGATVYISYDGAQFGRFEEFIGLRSHGIVKSGKMHTAHFDFGDINYYSQAEVLAENADAEILAVNETGNVVFSKHGYGKGTVYFLNAPIEKILSHSYDAFNSGNYYKIYRTFADRFISAKPITTENPDIGLTLHKVNEGEYIVMAINYSDCPQNCDFTVKDGWKLTPINNAGNTVEKCTGVFFRLNFGN